MAPVIVTIAIVLAVAFLAVQTRAYSTGYQDGHANSRTEDERTLLNVRLATMNAERELAETTKETMRRMLEVAERPE